MRRAVLSRGLMPLSVIATLTCSAGSLPQGTKSPQMKASTSQVAVAAQRDALSRAMARLGADSFRTLASQRAASPASSDAITTSLRGMPFRATSTCVRCNTGPASAAIAYWAVTGSQAGRQNGLASYDVLLRTQRQSNGALYKSRDGGDIDTMFFASSLGMSLRLLGPSLDRQHRASYVAAVRGAADYLILNKNLQWYTNGNIVIGNALVMALAHELTGDRKYAHAYEAAWSFAVSPPQKRWPGHGLVITKAAKLPDGRDGTGFFTEAGAKPGFDPDYTMLQAEQLARLLIVTGDKRVLRALNLIVNQLMLKVDTAKWLLDARGGSRHNPESPMTFDTSALLVLAEKGGRSDLARYVPSQVARIASQFKLDVAREPLGDRGYYALGMIPVTAISALATGP